MVTNNKAAQDEDIKDPLYYSQYLVFLHHSILEPFSLKPLSLCLQKFLKNIRPVFKGENLVKGSEV